MSSKVGHIGQAGRWLLPVATLAMAAAVPGIQVPALRAMADGHGPPVRDAGQTLWWTLFIFAGS